MKQTQRVSRGVTFILAAWAVLVLAGCNGGTDGAALTSPAAPSGLIATAASTTVINLAWTDNSNNETGFKIERSADNITFTEIVTTAANVVAYSNTGLSASATYYYRVRATNSAGDSAYSSVANATTSGSGTFTTFQAASVVIGQPTFTAHYNNQDGLAGANTINSGPYGNPVVVNGVLYVSDNTNNRVLGFNSIPTSNDASADFVLGQPDMTSTGTGSAANQLTSPEGVASDGTRLFVTDYNNSRILIWNTAPTTTQAAADVVVGQPGFGSVATGCTATLMNYPEGVTAAGGKLIVADTANSRILIWNSIPATNGVPADIVLGQNSFTTCVGNDDNQDGTQETATARTFWNPSGIWSNGIKLIVADRANDRVLIWNSFPTTNFQAADVVLGVGTLSYPFSLDSDGTRLFVADYYNNRVLIWNSIPTDDSPADAVLGQSDFMHTMQNDDDQDGANDGAPTARTLFHPIGVYAIGTKLFVADGENSRILIFEAH